jgi:hypothetical protein
VGKQEKSQAILNTIMSRFYGIGFIPTFFHGDYAAG